MTMPAGGTSSSQNEQLSVAASIRQTFGGVSFGQQGMNTEMIIMGVAVLAVVVLLVKK